MGTILNHLIALFKTSDLHVAILFFMALFYPHDLVNYWSTAGDLSLVMINEFIFAPTGIILAIVLSPNLKSGLKTRIKIFLVIFLIGLAYFIGISSSTGTYFSLKAYIYLSIFRFPFVIKGPSKEAVARLITDNSFRCGFFIMSAIPAVFIDFGSLNEVLKYSGKAGMHDLMIFKTGLIYFSAMGLINYNFNLNDNKEYWEKVYSGLFKK